MNDLKSILRFAPGLLALLFAVSITSAAEGDATKEKKPSKAALEKYDANKDGMLEGAKTAWRDIALSRQWTLPMISPDWQLPPGAYAHGCAGPT